MSTGIRYPRPRATKPRVDREGIEARALMQRVFAAQRQEPALAYLFHVPNGGGRSKATAGRLKAEGVRPGVPDYLMLVPRGDYSGLAIELKAKGGRPTKEQRDWLKQLSDSGLRTAVCYGWEEAWSEICGYLRGAA